MAKKGSAKNTKNKALHTKLMTQKYNKKKTEVTSRKDKLKAIVKAANEKKENL